MKENRTNVVFFNNSIKPFYVESKMLKNLQKMYKSTN